jgi:hypothetical protein
MCFVIISNTTIETTIDSNDVDLSAYKEAMQSSERNRWQEAIRKDLEPLFLNNTSILPNNLEIGQMPSTAKALPYKWILKRKLNSDN